MLYMNNISISADIWQKVYCEHPIIKMLTKSLLWTDEAEKTFVADNGKITDINGENYAPQGKIRPAHTIDMSQDDTLKWQNYFTSNNIKQAFEQVWEPIVYTSDIDIKKIIKDAKLTKKERNELKKALKLRGIKVYSNINGEFDYRSYSYVRYSDYNTMHFDDQLSVKYEYVDDDDESIKFCDVSIPSSGQKYKLNVIIFELAKAVIKQIIANDRAEVLLPEVLACFTAAQIIDFTNLSANCNSVNCTAVLLEYKKRNFPDFNPFDEFVLDW